MSEETAVATQECPECGSEEDWGGGSWCPDCGYYPAINRQVDAPPSVEEEEVFEHWWDVVPQWLWLSLAGVVAIFILSLSVRLLFSDNPIRTWWTVGQLAAGGIGLGVVHFMAYLYGVSRSDKLGPLDMFLQPIATWQPALRDLPKSTNLVFSLSCSLSAIGFALVVVDGVDFVALMQADAEARKQARAEQEAKDAAEGKKKSSPMAALLKTATTVASVQNAMSGPEPQPDSLEDALNSFAGAAPVAEVQAYGALDGGGGGINGMGAALHGLTENGGVDAEAYIKQQQTFVEQAVTGGKSDDAGPNGGTSMSPARGAGNGNRTSPVSTTADKPAGATGDNALNSADQVECLILGYTTNGTGDIRSLLLAAAPDRRLLRFVAKVPVEDIDEAVLETLVALFPDMRARKPMVRCPYGGQWVRPELFCVVSYTGWTAANRLRDAKVVQLLTGAAQ